MKTIAKKLQKSDLAEGLKILVPVETAGGTAYCLWPLVNFSGTWLVKSDCGYLDLNEVITGCYLPAKK